MPDIQTRKIKVAIIGAGNCAKSLLEGIAHYTANPDDTTGLMHPVLGGYRPSDITFVAAFDVDSRKVGRPLHEAVQAEPNHTEKIADPLPYDVIVQKGPVHDSINRQMRDFAIIESNLPPVNVAEILKKSGAEIVVNYLPTGSDEAVYAYAEAALEAGCSFINCMPTPIATNLEWRERFEARGRALMGNDVKSQLGATVFNKDLLELFRRRGVKITESTQVNRGGNADHENLHFRPEAKKRTKKAALFSVVGSEDAVPSATMIYTPANFDHKQAEIVVKGKIFGHAPVSVSAVLEDPDSPNSGGVIVDAIRIVRIVCEQGRAHDAAKACAFLMKDPPHQLPESEALATLHEAVAGPVNDNIWNRIGTLGMWRAAAIAASLVAVAVTGTFHIVKSELANSRDQMARQNAGITRFVADNHVGFVACREDLGEGSSATRVYEAKYLDGKLHFSDGNGPLAIAGRPEITEEAIRGMGTGQCRGYLRVPDFKTLRAI